MTPARSPRRSMLDRVRVIALGAALVVAACSGSDAATSGSVPDVDVEPASTSGDDVFSEGDTATDATSDVGESSGTTDPDITRETDAADVDEPDEDAPTGSDVDTETDAPNEDPTDTDPDPSTEADDSETGGSVEGQPEVEPEPDELDDIADIIALDDVDDSPFCQSYARIFESFLAISFGGAFGQVGSADPEAVVALSETYEVIVYPGLIDDVETIRSEDIDELDQFFGPLFERIDAAPRLLADAGLSGDEITELTSSARTLDLEAIDLDTLDQRVEAAAAAMIAEFGSFIDASESLSTPSGDEAAFEERLTALCPLLAASFDDV